MRCLTMSVLSIAFLFSVNTVSAAGPVIESHAMLYYQIPLGSSKTAQQQHTFGFRMDQFRLQAGQVIEYQQILKKPAVFDFKLSYRGVAALTIGGNDYVERYRVNRADGEDSTAPSLAEIIEDLPFGVFLGVGIGVAILTGAGG